MTHAQLLADATAATMPVSFDQFSDFIAIFDDRPSGPWCIFDHLCTRTKTLKPSLCGGNGNCIGSIYAVFSLYFAPCLRRYNSRTTKNKQQYIKHVLVRDKSFPKSDATNTRIQLELRACKDKLAEIPQDFFDNLYICP